MKRIIALFLTLALTLGSAILPSPVHAKGNSNEFQEADYKVENVDGASYKVYEFTDVVGKPAPKRQLKIGGLEISEPKIMRALRGADPALGEEIPDADRYTVDVQWTTYDLQPDALGTPVHFLIYEKKSKKIIAQTEDVTQAGLAEVEKNTPKGPTYKYKFKKLPAWDDSGVSHDPVNWQVRAPNEYRFDVRLRTSIGGNLRTSDIVATINQRGMPIYRAEYYTNGTAPSIKVQRTNKKDNTKEVPINSEKLGENQYYSWAEAPEGNKTFFEGRLLDIQKYGDDSLMSLQVSEPITAGRVKMAMKAPGKTEFDRGPGAFTDNGTPYHYEVTGDYLHLHIFTIRQDLKVNFDANKGTWKTAAPEAQTIGHSMKLADKWANLGPIKVPGENDLTPPAVNAGEKEKKFIGWNTDANASTVLFKDSTDVANYVEPIKDNTTFYAIYQEKPQGIAKVKYNLGGTEKEASQIDAKYKIAKDYPSEVTGNKDEAISKDHLDKGPQLLGYKFTKATTRPVPARGEKASYTESGKYTVIYNYDKLPDIIPAKTDDGSDNPLVTPDVKATYIPVTIKVDSNKGQFKKAGAVKTEAEFKYYVNPVEGKTLDNVKAESGLTAEAKDTNVNQIDTTKPWIFAPDKTKANADVATSTEVNKDNFNTGENGGVTMEVNFKQSEADKLKDKLKPVDIKVWQDDTDTDGSKVPWKTGVALKAKDDTLQGILDKATTKVSDLGEGGTLDAPKTSRNSFKQNLPDGKAGNLKVAFEDGSSLVVENQKLYVAPHKNVVKEGEPNQINPENLPGDKIAVEFKLGEGVKIGDKNGDKTTPVLYETFYVQPGTSLEGGDNGDIPKTEVQDNYKDNEWYNGAAKLAEADYTNITKAKEFTAKAVLKGQGSAELAFEDDKGNAIDILNTKKDLQLPKQDYVQSMQGNDGTKINYDKSKAPKILGYEFTNEEPVISTPNFEEDKTATITLKYKKIDDIIGPNKPADQKPEGYVTVAFKKATGATLDPSEMSYFVNPMADVKAKVSKVGDNYQISGKKADGTDLTGNVPAINISKPSEYEKVYADADKTWAYNNFDYAKNSKPITTDLTFTAQVIKLNEPKVTFPDVEIEKGGSKEVTPEVRDKYGKKIAQPGKPKVKETPEGVKVTPNDDGTVKIEVPKNYKGNGSFTIKVTYKVDGKDIPGDINVKIKEDNPVEPKNYDGYINLEPVGETKPDHATDIHVLYLYGYQDKTVHPQGDMTRAEAAAMVARLKNLDMSDTSKPAFKDVESKWYNSAINAVVKAGLMKGYPDGTFAPNGKITRAEFAQLIKGIDNPNMAELPFTDVAGHWGLDAISQAYANKRIAGYPDNTFRPNNDITRAEAVTILNSLFDRGINEAGLANVRKDIVEFKDLDRSHWAYYQIVEASNTHEYYRQKDGEVPEVWVRVLKTWNDFLK